MIEFQKLSKKWIICPYREMRKNEPKHGDLLSEWGELTNLIY